MHDAQLLKTVYYEICNQVCNLYGMRAEIEHEFINEFLEGSVPSFKLILVHKDDGPGFVMVSFHIEVEAAVAIQWFLRLRALDPNMRVTACYLRDSTGTPYVGEDAHILKMYTVEQAIISQFVAGDRDAEEIVGLKAVPMAKPVATKVYSDCKIATHAFDRMVKTDGDVEH